MHKGAFLLQIVETHKTARDDSIRESRVHARQAMDDENDVDAIVFLEQCKELKEVTQIVRRQGCLERHISLLFLN